MIMENANKTLYNPHTGTTKMDKETVDNLYSLNGIRREKCELYNDYVQSLLMLMFDTYLGDDITNHTERINHFKWCWNKNRVNFLKEGYNIDHEELFNYFLEFSLNIYYTSTNKDSNPNITSRIIKLIDYLFDYTSNKSEPDLHTFIKVYNLFEKALKN